MPQRRPNLACLVCDGALADHGERASCASCHSCLVTTEALTAAVQSMWSGHGGPLALPAIEPTEGTQRPCPRCAQPMSGGRYVSARVDRCVAHGVWFDRDELQSVLQAAARTHARQPRRRLRDVAGEVATCAFLIALVLLLVAERFYC